MKRKEIHEKFMTEKEKSYVAFVLTKNIRQVEKYKNYSMFFGKEFEKNNNKSKINTADSASNTKTNITVAEHINTASAEPTTTDSSNNTKMNITVTEHIDTASAELNTTDSASNNETMSNVTKYINAASAEANITDVRGNNTTNEEPSSTGATNDAQSKVNKKESAEKKVKIKEMFKTIGKTYKKSKKVPRIVIVDSEVELSRNMNIKIALEDFYDKIIGKIYRQKEIELEITEELFYYFLQIEKFYRLLILVFKNFDTEKLRVMFFYITKYCVKIKFVKEFERFVAETYTRFPCLDQQKIEESYFCNNFYFNPCNLLLGKYVLLSNDSFLPCLVSHLCDENLELVFALENELLAWEFLAVFVKKVNDTQKGVIVTLIKDRVLETMEKKNTEGLMGLNVFLESIGLEMNDLE